MEEKIKVNIPKNVYEILIKDMELFEFIKPNGSLNKNLFYNTLITNYYQNYSESEKKIHNTITDELVNHSNLKTSDIEYISSLITSKIQKYNLNLTSTKYEVSISMKPTGLSTVAFEYIYNYLLNNSTISSFFRNMFTSYSIKPQNLRERIIFKNKFDIINEGILKKKKIFFSYSKDNRRYEVSPYMIANSKEELFNYLLCSMENQISTFRITRINKIGLLNTSSSVPLDHRANLDLMSELGPQFHIALNEKETVVIRLSENGKRMFKSIYLHRPTPTKIENNLYYFDCSYNQLFQYFSRFGKFAYVLYPKSLRDRIKTFYLEGYNKYEAKKSE
ncbi:WYL domain-containing protein [Acholeplasma sp. OttesenSCG-928-E16]|nr:WYL domain-containing protein [Acholeplasma sp. OttesenSCG-928-E16]